jgi:hypothetical protein
MPTPAGWQNIYVNTGSEQVMAGFLIDSPAQPTLISVCVTGSIHACRAPNRERPWT